MGFFIYKKKEMYNFVKETRTYEKKFINVSGKTAQATYEEILKLPSTSATSPATSLSLSNKPKTRSQSKIASKRNDRIPFNERIFFKAVSTNDMATLQKIEIDAKNVNQRDQYGWTALMMAACEGFIDVFEFLCQHGADINICDKKGNSALSLARLKNKTIIIEYLNNINAHKKDSDINENSYTDRSTGDVDIYCNLCNETYKESKKVEHYASTLHRFNEKDSYKFTRRFGIPDSNVGFQMMLRQGWDREKGLGPVKEGHLYPIKTTIRKPRSGLGVKQDNKAKVTHFAPFDPTAIKATRPPIQKPKTKRDLRRESAQNRRKERYLRYILS